VSIPKKVILAWLVVLIAALGTYAALRYYVQPPRTAFGPAVATLVVDFDGMLPTKYAGNCSLWELIGGNWTRTVQPCNRTVWHIENLTAPQGTVWSLLSAAAAACNFTFDAAYYQNFGEHLITSVQDVRNGAADKYWQYWCDGVYGDVGADQKRIGNGDVIEWRFEKSQFG